MADSKKIHDGSSFLVAARCKDCGTEIEITLTEAAHLARAYAGEDGPLTHACVDDAEERHPRRRQSDADKVRAE